MSTEEPKKKRKETRQTMKGREEYHFDLRQDIVWNLYTDQRSETFNNAYKSAVKAGYSPNTAKRISSENWWLHRIKMLREMLPLAEKNMMEDMEMKTTIPFVVAGKIEEKIEPQLRRIRSDTSRFIAGTVGRNKYHTKTEVENSGTISLVEGNTLIDNLFKKK